MVKGMYKAELLVLASPLQRAVHFHKVNGFSTLQHGDTHGSYTQAACMQAELFLPWHVPQLFITNKAHMGLMNPAFTLICPPQEAWEMFLQAFGLVAVCGVAVEDAV